MKKANGILFEVFKTDNPIKAKRTCLKNKIRFRFIDGFLFVERTQFSKLTKLL